ncbi:VOC family protein [Paenibacillus rhizovicinus]|uniref:VOC family protein n=1 Tax=Paenibacillus rhizovicinus TaxID=2704463 RepID=A0A6C0P682_9BACL|nr:VOC family protein [Paenibacillus rhizovicinus]QHW34028.1 VOC family protein [Paenibacillus rhizovicinus]
MSEQQSVTKSPVVGGVPAVFVHVKDLSRSIAWYSKLLGIPAPQTERSDIHIFQLENGANIFLVRSDEVTPSRHVLCSLPTPDLNQAERFFAENAIEIVDKDDETINFQDPDGNILMACSI